MIKCHVLKLESEFCDAVESGEKTFEVRINDRGFQVGDHIKFKAVFNGKEIFHSINDKDYEITYIIHGWGLKTGYVALAIKDTDPQKKNILKPDIVTKICKFISNNDCGSDECDNCPLKMYCMEHNEVDLFAYLMSTGKEEEENHNGMDN
jgi:hypothetical protein